MNPINYLTDITLGAGAVKTVRAALDRLGVKRPLVVTDTGVRSTAAFGAVMAYCGTEASVFDATPSNPTEEAVEEALQVYRGGRCDGVIAVGGGSPIDLAKAVALLATHPAPLSQYALVLGGLARITAAVVPIIAVPTTAGTGSEVGRGALITLRDGRKLGFISAHVIPKAAICDPALTLTMPRGLTAATGMDALAHCIETFLSPRINPVADAIALDGAGRAYNHIEKAVESGSDLDARAEMMTASLMGGLCFQKGLGAVHSLSHALGAIKTVNLHHGTLNAVLLPPVLRANAAYVGNKYQRLLRAMGLDATADFPSVIEDLNARLRIPARLSDMGVTPDMLPGVVTNALKDHSHATNPFQPDEAGYMAILTSVL